MKTGRHSYMNFARSKHEVTVEIIRDDVGGGGGGSCDRTNVTGVSLITYKIPWSTRVQSSYLSHPGEPTGKKHSLYPPSTLPPSVLPSVLLALRLCFSSVNPLSHLLSCLSYLSPFSSSFYLSHSEVPEGKISPHIFLFHFPILPTFFT